MNTSSGRGLQVRAASKDTVMRRLCREELPWPLFLLPGRFYQAMLFHSTLGLSAMTFPVIVHRSNGQFEAALVGAPEVRATAATREEALAALEAALARRLDKGELVALEVPRRGLAGLFGKYRDDPTLREICEAAYQERDAGVRE